jgi:hypothetical protein
MLVCNQCRKKESNAHKIHEKCTTWYCRGRFEAVKLIVLRMNSIREADSEEEEWVNIGISSETLPISAEANLPPPASAAAHLSAVANLPPPASAAAHPPKTPARPTSHFLSPDRDP